MKLLIAFTLISLSSSASGFLIQQKVYVQQDTTDNYLYSYELPAMDEYTYCLWLNMEEGNTQCYPASVASKSYANELLIGWYELDKDDTKIYIAGKNDPIRVPLSQDLRTAVKNGWHKHCFVNKKGHYIKWFMDRQKPGVVEEIQTVPSVTGILAGSALILLQEQDSFKGSLVLNQVCQSKMSMFNMWDKAMTQTELNTLRCQDQGNVVNMSNISSMGGEPEYETYPLPCHQGDFLTEENVYVQRDTIDNYLYKYDLPAMDEYTYCLWLNMEEGNTQCYPASISSKSYANELLIGWYQLDKDDTKIYIAGKNAPIRVPLSQDLRTAVKNGWHKHCFVNKKGHYIKWFMDRQTPGLMEEIQTVASVTGIAADSALVLLQEQDSFKGSFVLDQVCQSKMSMFNMWDKAMTLSELNALGCQDKGTVVNMDSITSMGAAPEYESYSFPCRQEMITTS